MCNTTTPNRQTNTLTAPMATVLRACGYAIHHGPTGWYAARGNARIYPAYTGHGFIVVPAGRAYVHLTTGRGHYRRATLARAIATANR